MIGQDIYKPSNGCLASDKLLCDGWPSRRRAGVIRYAILLNLP
jgi:hypothetical protein